MAIPIISPAIPFLGAIPGGLNVGTQIIVEGHIPQWFAHRFEINLVCGHNPSTSHANNADIALHFNPRFEGHHIVLNTKRNRNWEQEQQIGPIPIQKGRNFEVVITVEPQWYRININGSHWNNFSHRMPFQDVGLIWIQGRCDITKIEFRGNTGARPSFSYPTPVVPAPVYHPPAPRPIYPTAPAYPTTPVVHYPPHHSHHHHHPHHGSYHVPQSAGSTVPGFNPAPVHVLPTPSAAQFGGTVYSASQGVPLGAQPAQTYSSSSGMPLGSQPAPGYPYR